MSKKSSVACGLVSNVRCQHEDQLPERLSSTGNIGGANKKELISATESSEDTLISMLGCGSELGIETVRDIFGTTA
jgi:hypothetical protein